MENRKEFIVNEDEIGLRLDAFLASKEDIESAYNDITIIAKTVPRLC